MHPQSSTPREIPLTQGKVALIDAADFERVNQYKWYARLAKSGIWYAMRNTPGHPRKTLLLHRFITNAPPGVDIDHWDRDGLNCQRYNLRECDNAKNMHNRKRNKKGTSQYKGVHWHTRNSKWLASIQVNHNKMHLGLFDNEEDAARAYDAKARELFGEFARTNF